MILKNRTKAVLEAVCHKGNCDDDGDCGLFKVITLRLEGQFRKSIKRSGIERAMCSISFSLLIVFPTVFNNLKLLQTFQSG